MFRRKTQEKRKRRSYWGWLTILASVAGLFIAVWRAMVKRISREREETLPTASEPPAGEEEQAPAASKPTGEGAEATQAATPKSAAKEREKTPETASPAAKETPSSEVDLPPHRGKARRGSAGASADEEDKSKK